MTASVREPYFFHCFDDHNDEAFYQNGEFPYWVDRDAGYGGFTLGFYPERKVVSISICGTLDRYVKKVGRENVTAFAERICPSSSLVGGEDPLDPLNWSVLCPRAKSTSEWVEHMLKAARNMALTMLVEDYPGEQILFEFFNPVPKPEPEPKPELEFDAEICAKMFESVLRHFTRIATHKRSHDVFVLDFSDLDLSDGS